MEVNKAPKGLIVDLITPLDDKGDIDNDGLLPVPRWVRAVVLA